MQTLPEAAISLRVYGGPKVNALPLLRIALRALPSVRSWSTACKGLLLLCGWENRESGGSLRYDRGLSRMQIQCNQSLKVDALDQAGAQPSRCTAASSSAGLPSNLTHLPPNHRSHPKSSSPPSMIHLPMSLLPANASSPTTSEVQVPTLGFEGLSS